MSPGVPGGAGIGSEQFDRRIMFGWENIKIALHNMSKSLELLDQILTLFYHNKPSTQKLVEL